MGNAGETIAGVFDLRAHRQIGQAGRKR